jgi:hypothetical protein
MGRLRKILDLSNDDRRLLLQAFAAVVGTSVAVRLLPGSVILRKVAEEVPLSVRRQSPTIERIAWAVAVAARYIPGSKCLVQALAGRNLLASYGFRSEIRIGVAKDPKKWLTAHAWVEVDGKTLIGGDTAGYAPLIGANVEYTP